MIPTVHNCPFCAQEFSRKYNKEVHIKRRHNGTRLPLNGASNATSFGYSSYNPNQNQNQNPNYNPSNVAGKGEGIWGQTSGGNWQGDFMDSMIGFFRKQVEVLRYQVEIKELSSRFVPPPYYPPVYSQQFYYPPTLGRFVQKSPNFLGLPFYQSSPAINTGSINIIDPASDRNDKNLGEGEASVKQSYQLMSLRGSICEKCLTIFTIPIYLYENRTLKEIYNHSCNDERVSDLGRQDKYNLDKFFIILRNLLPKILVAKVMKCNRSQAKFHLCFMKRDGLLPNTEVYSYESVNYPIRYHGAFPSEH
jgi:hypothetical protein